MKNHIRTFSNDQVGIKVYADGIVSIVENCEEILIDDEFFRAMCQWFLEGYKKPPTKDGAQGE